MYSNPEINGTPFLVWSRDLAGCVYQPNEYLFSSAYTYPYMLNMDEDALELKYVRFVNNS